MLKIILYVIGGFLLTSLVGWGIFALFVFYIFRSGSENLGDPIDATKSNQYYYSKKKDTVYFVSGGEKHSALGHDKLKLDLETVQVLSSSWIRDKSNIYFREKNVTPKIKNLGSFKLFSGKYFYDEEFFYYMSSRVPEAVERTNLSQVKVFQQHLVTTKGAYFQEQRLPGVPAAGFQELENSNYAKDDNQVYYREHSLVGVDTKSFKILSPSRDFGSDNQSLYFENRKINFVPLADLRLVENERNYFFINGDRVYVPANIGSEDDRRSNQGSLELIEVPSADPKTFKNIELSFYEDKKSVYYMNYKLENAIPGKTEAVRGWDQVIILDDKRAVIMTSEEIKKEFSYLKESSYRLRKNGDFYSLNHHLNEVDKATFEVLGLNFARDKDNYYYYQFRVVNPEFAKKIIGNPSLEFSRIFRGKTVELIPKQK